MVEKSLKISAFLSRLGRLAKIFLLLFMLKVVYWGTARLAGVALPGRELLDVFFSLVALVLGFLYARRLIRRVLWRMRNRLIVAYIFIGVVPIVLILAMLAIGMTILMGQAAAYLMTAELNRRNESIRSSAHTLGWNLAYRMGSERGEVIARQLLVELRGRFPNLQAVVRAGGKTFSIPPDAGLKEFPGWSKPDFTGLVHTGRKYLLAAHAQAGDLARNVEVFAYEPADPDLLAGLVPGLASVQFLGVPSGAVERRSRQTKGKNQGVLFRVDMTPDSPTDSLELAPLPAARGWWDFPVGWLAPVTVWRWDSERSDQAVVAVLSRPSLIIHQLFSTLGQRISVAIGLVLAVIGGTFLLVELTSLIFGVGLTRSLTRSIADLYEATGKIKVGDFSHRIPIRTKDQLSELAGSFNRMTENIQNLILESKEKERLESELKIAREVQSQLFPRGVPRLKTLELAGACNPARVVSGDYYDFVPLDSNLTALAISDVSGKGISAALLMASIQSALRAQLTFRLAPQSGSQAPGTSISTSTLVAVLNRQLYESTAPEKYATFFCAVYDDPTGRLFYTNAGHLPPLLIRKGNAIRLEVSGMVVGAFPDSRYEQDYIQLEPGDLLVAYTDGITESENQSGEQFGEERLADLLIRNAERPLDELVTEVTSAVSDWTQDLERQDDMTLLLARRL